MTTSKTLSPLDGLVVKYGNWLISHRLLTFALVSIVAAAAMFAATGLRFKDNYRVYFGESNPQLRAFLEIQDVYTKDDNILLVVTPESGTVFEPRTLTLIRELTEAAWELPFSSRVDSVSNFQHTTAEGDDLLVEDLVIDPASMDQSALDIARDVAVLDPVLRNRLINESATVTAVNVTLLLPEKELNEVSIAVTAARDLATRFEAKYADIEIRLAGTTMMSNAFAESARKDIKTLVPAMYAVIVLAVLLLVRCVWSALATLVVIFTSIIVSMGFAKLIGINLSSVAAAAPTIITTLAVADCIHIVVSMFAAMRRGMSKDQAIVESLRINMQPVFLTSITTAIGFLIMNFSDSPPFHDLGNITAFGILAAFVLSVTLFPAMLSVLPCKVHGKTGSRQRWLERFADWVIAHRKRLLLGGAVVCVAVLAFLPANELNDDFVKYFGPELQFRQDTDYTNVHLTGTMVFHFSLPAGQDNGVSDPAYLRTVEDFAKWYREQPNVVNVATVTDIFKRLNKNLHGDDPDYYRLPDDSALAAQYLFLYELSLPQGLDLTNQINLDKSASRFTVTANSMTSNELRALVGKGEQWLRDNAPQLYTEGVGVAVMFSYIGERNIRSMLAGSVFGLILISLILIVALRSFKIGMLSIIPNLLPIGLTFGLWGIVVGQINLSASVVSGMVLGIVVDDTVHFLSKYLRARRESNMNAEDAVRYAFSTVGLALVFTTLVLIAGFAILAQSSFGINSTMATLTAIAITIALIVDFLLLPPILLMADKSDTRLESADMETPHDKTYAAG